MHNLAIFGGTFDPLHNGHMQTSLTVQAFFNFETYYFVPCKNPVIKPDAHASTLQRIEMLELALHKHPHFSVDLRETNRESPSYTVETLASFRKEFADYSITLIIGYDAFLSLPQWYQWQQLINLANLLVLRRDAYAVDKPSEEVQAFLQQHEVFNKNQLLNSKAGCIMQFDAGNINISSSQLRQAIAQGEDISRKLPMEVWEYIIKNQVYNCHNL